MDAPKPGIVGLGGRGEDHAAPIAGAEFPYRIQCGRQQRERETLGLVKEDYTVCQVVELPAVGRAVGEERLKKAHRGGNEERLVPAGGVFSHLLRQTGLAVVLHHLGKDLPVHLGALLNEAEKRQYHDDPAFPSM